MVEVKGIQPRDGSENLAAVAEENSVQGFDVNGENEIENDEWVIVKKQRITIWIPPLSPPRPPAQSSRLARPKKKKKITLAGKRGVSRSVKKERIVGARNRRNQLRDSLEEPKKISKANAVASRPTSGGNNLLRTDGRIASGHTSELVGNSFPRSSWRSTRTYQTTKPRHQTLEGQRKFALAANSTSLGGNLLNWSFEKDKNKLFGTMSCLDVSVMQNWKRRAMNLERELERAGGFSRWLQLQGLGKFVQVFQGKNLGKLELVTLTMGKLKDMGIFAVGPRRKLIHAIDQISRPYLL